MKCEFCDNEAILEADGCYWCEDCYELEHEVTMLSDKQSLTVEGDAALDELARHEATIAVPREMLERWREVLLAIELSNNQEWEEYPDDMREIIDSMDALLSTSAENGSGGESE